MQADREKVQKMSRTQLLHDVKRKLSDLWDCQLESIISHIKSENLTQNVVNKRQNWKEEYKKIEELVLDYWRRDGTLIHWIEERRLIRGDYTLKISGFNQGMEGVQRKRDKIQEWLNKKTLNQVSGCYCFIARDKCLYVGQAIKLGRRIREHSLGVHVRDATKLRILVPNRIVRTMTTKDRLNTMERLLYLYLQPEYTGTAPPIGNNEADGILHFIKEEIKELATDAG